MEHKKWYTYKRNGIYSVIFLDKVTGKRRTAKSTGCRDREKAIEIINQWYYNPRSFFNQQQKEKDKYLFKNLLNDLDFKDKEISDVLKTFLLSEDFDFEKDFLINQKLQQYSTIIKKEPSVDIEFCPEEIKPFIEIIHTLKFTDYILAFWDYEKSPYIKQLYNQGGKIPGKERFYALTHSYKKYFEFYKPKFLLKDLKVGNINALLGKIKNDHGLAENTIQYLRNGLKQALDFAYKNNLLKKNIGENILSFSNKNQIEKQIFSQEEAKLIANFHQNIFEDETYFILNRLLLTTGCRIGEILALEKSDIIHNKNVTYLNISKSWQTVSRRLKNTKTCRKDMIPLSSEMAYMLLSYSKNMKNNDFLFTGKKSNKPLAYSSVYRNFKKSLKKIGILRKGLTLHSYRHTFATRLLEAGYTDMQLLFLTRHESLEQVKVYTNHENSKRDIIKQEAIDLTEKLLV